MTTKLKKKTYKKLGFTGLETVAIVKSLNKLLANYHIHSQKMKNFHWNIKGRDFFELHDIFEDLYHAAQANIDDVAERVRVFGQTPASRLKEYLDLAEIKEVGTGLTSEAMVRETLNDFQMLLSFMVDVADAAIDIGDVGTEDLINTFIKNMEKKHWMFNAWMHNPPRVIEN
ncbi:MAG: DNA starvation/stationary phase protection protein [Saprospiraceae bacterium]|nr:DNA starvation/stationary phase protection protein [Saprospiraceae bacterium]MCB9325577.1 DNA starvation/stationary phase protection protein [Lewinellaceae bacterium]